MKTPPYSVYILQSEMDDSYYVGFSADPVDRLAKHNRLHQGYTDRFKASRIDLGAFPFNPDIASTFFRAGLIEAWGRETLKIMEECHQANLIFLPRFFLAIPPALGSSLKKHLRKVYGQKYFD
ncbi:MAG TPA: GIY-YIG nuclease family protein [Saprospiraceae bacterium]|nr:GIY-YIG nuclease family protein [Saprospiraceae bacterium]HMQ82283.1 GIY-YIG nuclease family protein [Saprospiraceae bacterium]